mmetsp:Transcript_20687/g.43113  ORF Transcript_20687/g.43113 Transcript_20687/m.43113 type:complete len:241 (+) Transcript_20687:111-833(+)
MHLTPKLPHSAASFTMSSLCQICIVLFFSVLVSVVSSQAATEPTTPIPISASSFSFARGAMSSDIVVDMWIDLGCSDCMNDWPTLEEVYASYQNKVKFVYRLLPLPYHQFAFLLAKSAACVAVHSADADDVFDFFNTVYDPPNQALIYNSVTADMSYNSVMEDIVSKFVTNSSSITAEDYVKFMAEDYDLESNTRYGFKNAAIRGIYATPTFTVNGVTVQSGLDSFEDWQEMLDSLTNEL